MAIHGFCDQCNRYALDLERVAPRPIGRVSHFCGSCLDTFCPKCHPRGLSEPDDDGVFEDQLVYICNRCDHRWTDRHPALVLTQRTGPYRDGALVLVALSRWDRFKAWMQRRRGVGKLP